MRYTNIYNSNRAKPEAGTGEGSWFGVQGSEIRGQGSEVRGQGSGVRGQSLEKNSSFIIHHSSLRPSSSFILHPSSFRNPSSFRPGVTLIEMLIVVSIVMIMMVITLKAIQPTGDRRLRETARVVSAYLSSAQNRAMELGRPCGVIFRRAKGTNTQTASMTLDQCEVPPPYAGDMMNAVVKVQDWTYRTDYWTDSSNQVHFWPYWDNDKSAPPPVLKTLVLKVMVREGDFSSKLIRRGDLVQLNGQGPYFTIDEDPSPSHPRTNPSDASMPSSADPTDFPLDTDGSGYIDFAKGTDTNPADGWIDNHVLTLTLDATSLQSVPWPERRATPTTYSNPVSFQILRQPDKVRSSTSSLQLPKGAVIDLDLSGTDTQPFTGINDVSIIFSANGAVDGYYYNGAPQRAPGPIFLLIGQTKLIDPLGIDPDKNDTDLSNFWVTINPQTGLISTNEMASGATPFERRKYARESQSMGGR